MRSQAVFAESLKQRVKSSVFLALALERVQKRFSARWHFPFVFVTRTTRSALFVLFVSAGLTL